MGTEAMPGVHQTPEEVLFEDLSASLEIWMRAFAHVLCNQDASFDAKLRWALLSGNVKKCLHFYFERLYPPHTEGCLSKGTPPFLAATKDPKE